MGVLIFGGERRVEGETDGFVEAVQNTRQYFDILNIHRLPFYFDIAVFKNQFGSEICR